MGIRRIKVNGRWAYQARVAYQGARKSQLCASREAARDAEAALLQALKGAVAQADAEGAAPATLRAVCELYVADLAERGKDPERAAISSAVLEAVVPALLDRPVTALTAADLYAFRQARIRGVPNPDADPKTPGTRWVVEPVKEGTVNRDLRTLRAMLRKARPEFKFPAGVFCPEDETRVRWLRPEDELLVFELLPSPIREIARLAALTLMRESEILRLRRADVHLEQGVILLPRAKKGPRPVILNRAARAILQAQLDAHGEPLVFPSPTGGPFKRNHVSRRWRKAARTAGLQDFRFHDLRHHGATMALNAGFTAPIVMALGGWNSERMMRRYAAVTDKTLRAAAEAVSGNGAAGGNGEWQRTANLAPALSR